MRKYFWAVNKKCEAIKCVTPKIGTNNNWRFSFCQIFLDNAFINTKTSKLLEKYFSRTFIIPTS